MRQQVFVFVTCLQVILAHSDLDGISSEKGPVVVSKSDNPGDPTTPCTNINSRFNDEMLAAMEFMIRQQNDRMSELETTIQRQQIAIDSLVSAGLVQVSEKETTDTVIQQQNVRHASMETKIQQQAEKIALYITVIERLTEEGILSESEKNIDKVMDKFETSSDYGNAPNQNDDQFNADGRHTDNSYIYKQLHNTLAKQHIGGMKNMKKSGFELDEKFGIKSNPIPKEVQKRLDFTTALHVAFTTHLGNHHYTGDGTLIFDQTEINDGNGYNVHTGIFTVPTTGIYFFTFSTLLFHRTMAYVRLMKDGMIVANAYVYPHERQLNKYTTLSNSVITQANTGARLWVQLHTAANESVYSGFIHRAAQFSGFKIY